MNMPKSGQSLLVMIDECAELLSPKSGKALVAAHCKMRKVQQKIEDIRIGGLVLNSHNEEVRIVNKLTPNKQGRFKLCMEKTALKEKSRSYQESNTCGLHMSSTKTVQFQAK